MRQGGHFFIGSASGKQMTPLQRPMERLLESSFKPNHTLFIGTTIISSLPHHWSLCVKAEPRFTRDSALLPLDMLVPSRRPYLALQLRHLIFFQGTCYVSLTCCLPPTVEWKLLLEEQDFILFRIVSIVPRTILGAQQTANKYLLNACLFPKYCTRF